MKKSKFLTKHSYELKEISKARKLKNSCFIKFTSPIPEFVLNESEREARHAKRTSGKLKIVVAKSVSSTKTLEPARASATNDFWMASNTEALMWTFSKDEHQQLLKMVANLRRNITSYVPRFFSGNPDLFKELLK